MLLDAVGDIDCLRTFEDELLALDAGDDPLT